MRLDNAMFLIEISHSASIYRIKVSVFSKIHTYSILGILRDQKQLHLYPFLLTILHLIPSPHSNYILVQHFEQTPNTNKIAKLKHYNKHNGVFE